jgi:hypothetical protein
MNIFVFVLLIFVSSLTMAQVPAELSSTLVGKEAEVCGKVVNVSMSTSNDGTMRTTLSFGSKKDIVLMADLPKWDVVMAQRNLKDFKAEARRYLDSTVCITGTIKLQNIPALKNGMPYIVVDSPDNIKYK